MSQQIDFSIVNHVLNIDGDRQRTPVVFPWPIAQVIRSEDVLVVRIEPSPGACFNENVFGVLPNGTVAWTIAPRKHVYDDSPYTSMVEKGANVMLYNWDGDELLVDAKTGKLISVAYGK